jgi:hypothetical protein
MTARTSRVEGSPVARASYSNETCGAVSPIDEFADPGERPRFEEFVSGRTSGKGT